MTLVRWSPARSVFSLKSDLDRIFDNFLSDNTNVQESYSDMVPVDIEETENEFNIYAELPGMNKDDIKITFENNYLTLSGEKKAKKEIKRDNFHQIERGYGKFRRTIAIPSGIMLDKIEAQYDQGILQVRVPKAEEAKPKQISVKIK